MELHLGLSIIQINEEFQVNVFGLNCGQLWILDQYLGYRDELSPSTKYQI